MKGYGIIIGCEPVPRKVKLGETNQYLDMDSMMKDIMRKDDEGKDYISELIKERKIKCSLCKILVSPDNWTLISVDPEDATQPVQLHIFHKDKGCEKRWKATKGNDLQFVRWFYGQTPRK